MAKSFGSSMGAKGKDGVGRRRFSLTQEHIVFVLTICMLAVFSISLDNFFTTGNVLTLLRNVSVLGMLGLGMSVVVIGRGIDLSMIATLVIGMGWSLKIASYGWPFEISLIVGGLFAIAVGVIVGAIIAYAEIPAVFATLAMGPVIFGFGNAFLFFEETHLAPTGIAWLHALGYSTFLEIPISIWAFATLALIVHFVMRKTRFGRSIYAMGDNPVTARVTGLPVRPIIVGQYALTALIAFFIGLVLVASNSGINTRLFFTTIVYDVVLVVVLGGIGLSGGRGNVRNVMVGTLFVGTLLTGMTIMNLTFTTQNLIKSFVMLMALVAETLANPRDEQTSQQGDI